MNIPTIDRIGLKYNCPLCKNKANVSMPWIENKHLSDPTRSTMVVTVCKKCGEPHHITYTMKNNKKIKLVDFTCKDKSYLSRIKRNCIVGSN